MITLFMKPFRSYSCLYLQQKTQLNLLFGKGQRLSHCLTEVGILTLIEVSYWSYLLRPENGRKQESRQNNGLHNGANLGSLILATFFIRVAKMTY